MATAATIFMALVGPEGFREVGRASYNNAHYLAEKLAEIDGVRIDNDGEFFNEFTFSSPIAASRLNRALFDAGIIGGLDLGTVAPSLTRSMLVAATELTKKAGMDRFVEVVRELTA
jgi:glycine cleavage system P protein (glycine dehydrogenase) subunit 1